MGASKLKLASKSPNSRASRVTSRPLSLRASTEFEQHTEDNAERAVAVNRRGMRPKTAKLDGCVKSAANLDTQKGHAQRDGVLDAKKKGTKQMTAHSTSWNSQDLGHQRGPQGPGLSTHSNGDTVTQSKNPTTDQTTTATTSLGNEAEDPQLGAATEEQSTRMGDLTTTSTNSDTPNQGETRNETPMDIPTAEITAPPATENPTSQSKSTPQPPGNTPQSTTATPPNPPDQQQTTVSQTLTMGATSESGSTLTPGQATQPPSIGNRTTQDEHITPMETEGKMATAIQKPQTENTHPFKIPNPPDQQQNTTSQPLQHRNRTAP